MTRQDDTSTTTWTFSQLFEALVAYLLIFFEAMVALVEAFAMIDGVSLNR